MEEIIVNKVAQSGILTFNLEDFYPQKPIAELDIKQFLYMGLILKEKDFREKVKSFDWKIYENQIVTVFCSEDAIIPTWAYMIIATALHSVNAECFFGNKKDYLNAYYYKVLNEMDLEGFRDKNVVIKGCGEKDIPISAYVIASQRLVAYVKKLFYGEPCSTVPIWKKS